MEYWSEDEERLLRQLRGEKLTYKEIAIQLHKTKNAVIGKLNRLGLLGECRRKPERAIPDKPSAGVMVARKVSLPEASSREARVTDGSRLPQSQKQCRWPIGDPRDKDFHFCTKDHGWNSPFCEEHRRIAYQGVTSAYRRWD